MTNISHIMSTSEGESIDLPEWQVYRAYLEGSNLVQKPKMLDKMNRNGVAFSWFTLLLGPIYYVYRKQYIAGWLYFLGINVLSLLLTALSVFVSPMLPVNWIDSLLWCLLLSLIVLYAANIAMSFAFYPLYRRSAKRAYENWKIEGGEDMGDAIRYLEKKGGISWTQVIAMIVLNIVISFATNGSLPFM